MHKNEDERLSDIIMGEAVIELLDEIAPVTISSLLLKLQAFLLREENANKEKAIRRAIDEVKAATDRDSSLRQGGATLPNTVIRH